MTGRGFRLCASAFLAAVLSAAARGDTPRPPAFEPIGLPSSRSSSPVFNRFAWLPPFTAAQPRSGEWFIVPTLSISQAMIASLLVDGEGAEIPVVNVDYETISFELPLSFGLGGSVSLEADFQAQYLWGGLLDGPIQLFHELFGFPNGGRELFAADQVNIAVPTKNGFDYRAYRSAFLVSDPVFGAAFRLLRTPSLALTGRIVAAVPLGLGDGLAGTELPQFGAGLYADWKTPSGVVVNGLLGGMLPLESLIGDERRPYPTLQVRLSSAVPLSRGLLLFLDLNLKSSPVGGYVYAGDIDFFALPNADLFVGLVFAGPEKRDSGSYGAFSVQEDPISHNSADIGFLGTWAFRSRGILR